MKRSGRIAVLLMAALCCSAFWTVGSKMVDAAPYSRGTNKHSYKHSHATREQRDELRQAKIEEWIMEHYGAPDPDAQLITTSHMSAIDLKVIENEHDAIDGDVQKKEYSIVEASEQEAVGGTSDPTVLILSGCDSSCCDEEFTQTIIENRKAYAHRHGYYHLFLNLSDFQPAQEENIHPMWLKVPAIKHAFELYPNIEWIWWLDVDAIIMNPEIALGNHLLNEDFLSKKISFGKPLRSLNSRFKGHRYLPKSSIDVSDVDVIISQDSLGLNTGSFFLRRSEFANLLLSLWSDPYLRTMGFERKEQDALIYLLLKHKYLLKHCAIVPQRLINSYHDGTKSHLWRYHEGDFVIHFAGLGKYPEFKSIWKLYWNSRGH
ncbi:hypothetical protein TRVA0_037S00716 [Trichomonascus vanleenenianus]|uniref:uncharacterized protein n=1 Tax=Trichomonascus vanleenenianus TaxID=2268995 RepID=UPI003EC99446